MEYDGTPTTPLQKERKKVWMAAETAKNKSAKQRRGDLRSIVTVLGGGGVGQLSDHTHTPSPFIPHMHAHSLPLLLVGRICSLQEVTRLANVVCDEEKARLGDVDQCAPWDEHLWAATEACFSLLANRMMSLADHHNSAEFGCTA